MKKRPLSVYIVDDSRVSRELLEHIICSDPELTVVGFAENGKETLDWLKNNTPDVITMDVVMPGVNGFEVTRRVMETKPIPIIIISSVYTPRNAEQGFEAMEAGALAMLEKPVSIGNPNYENNAEEIRKTLKMVAEVRLIKRHKRPEEVSVDKVPLEIHSRDSIEAIAIGTSLGGPVALAQILKDLPASFPVPIFIAQHIPVGFSQGLVQWLQGQTQLKVELATDQAVALPGHCYIAPGGSHLLVKKDHRMILDTRSKDLLKPSVAQLFRSMAETYGPHAVGVMLTGMGKDGAQELLMMRRKGAYTIAQDEETCIMFGMPREAIEIDAVECVLPIQQIAKVLKEIVVNSGQIAKI